MTSPNTAADEMTAEKFFQLPEGPPYFELIDGDLHLSPARFGSTSASSSD